MSINSDASRILSKHSWYETISLRTIYNINQKNKKYDFKEIWFIAFSNPQDFLINIKEEIRGNLKKFTENVKICDIENIISEWKKQERHGNIYIKSYRIS